MRPEEKRIVNKLLLIAVLAVLCTIVVLPQAGNAVPCDENYDYKVCLSNHTANPDFCACCVISSPGSKSISNCPNIDLLSHCPKPIGILINQSSTYFKGTNEQNVIKLIKFVPQGTPSCEIRNVGILAKIVNQTTPEGIILSTYVSNVSVQNWTNGILFWRMQNGVINNSIITNNYNGVYLFNSQLNNISSNIINLSSNFGIVLESNKTGMHIDPNDKEKGWEAKSIDNVIYDNYFNNSQNVSFLMIEWGGGRSTWDNTWYNINTPLGPNILELLGERHGDYIGGNFWANPTRNGFSENSALCQCNQTTGFCNNPFNLDPGTTFNTDVHPLCKPEPPFIDMTVTGDILGWMLNQGTNTADDQIHVNITTNSHNWWVDVSDYDNPLPSYTNGHMVKYHWGIYDHEIFLHYLLNLSQGSITITLKSGTHLITGSAPVTSRDYPVSLSQEVDLTDKILPPGDVYRVVIKFTATAWG